MKVRTLLSIALVGSAAACSGAQDGYEPDGSENPDLVASGRYALLGDCTVQVAVDPMSPQPAGTNIAITADATCLNEETPEYRFYVRNPSGAWQLHRDWHSSNVYDWDSTESQTGDHSIQVWARRTGQTDVEGVRTIPYMIEGGRQFCSAGSLEASLTSPQAAGPIVALTGQADCGAATPEYRFLLRDPFGTWTQLSNWTTSPSVDWNTSVYLQGAYEHQVWIRPQGTDVQFDTRGILPFELSSGGAACMALQASTSPQSPQAAGTLVTINGAAECGGGAVPHYRFYVRELTGTWTLLQNYSETSHVDWTPMDPGTYSIQVWMRSSLSSNPYDLTRTLQFTATEGEPGDCTNLGLSLDPSGSTTVGTPVTSTASSSCTGSATAEYRFYLRRPGQNYVMIQQYSTDPSVEWSPTEPGEHWMQVWMRKVGSTVSNEWARTAKIDVE